MCAMGSFAENGRRDDVNASATRRRHAKAGSAATIAASGNKKRDRRVFRSQGHCRRQPGHRAADGARRAQCAPRQSNRRCGRANKKPGGGARRLRAPVAPACLPQEPQRAAPPRRHARDEAWTLPYNADSHGGVFAESQSSVVRPRQVLAHLARPLASMHPSYIRISPAIPSACGARRPPQPKNGEPHGLVRIPSASDVQRRSAGSAAIQPPAFAISTQSAIASKSARK